MPGRARQRRADEERRGDHAVDVDAHHLGRLAVERGRAHRPAELRAGDEVGQPAHQDDRAGDDDDLRDRDVDTGRQREAVAPELAVPPAEGVEALVVGPEHEQGRVLEEEGDAERRDQRRDPRRLAQPAVGEALDHDAEQAAAEHRRDEHQGEQEADRDRDRRRPAEHGQHAEADERADHEDVAVGEVQQLEDPVHHRVAEGDQRVDAAVRDPGHELGDEEVPVHWAGNERGTAAAAVPRRELLRDRLVLAADDLEDVELRAGDVAVRGERHRPAEDRRAELHLRDVLPQARCG